MSTGSSSGPLAGVAGNSFRNDGGETVNNKVAFSVHRNGSTFNVANNTPTKVQCTTREFDQDSSYDNSTNFRFAPKPGKYSLMGNVSTNGAVAVDQGQIVALIYKNGSQYKSGDFVTASGTDQTGSNVACIAIADPGDYFELFVSQINGGASAIVFSGLATDTWFQGFQIG